MSDNDDDQQQQQHSTGSAISKLDIALLAGVARQETKTGQNMNLKWLTKSRLVIPTDLRTCDDVASWAALSPSEIDVNGTELIRSPRSALAVLRNGASVRELVDSDLPTVHALSRKAKLTKEETVKRIELDRARRAERRTEVQQAYGALCADFSRQEIITAVRRFLFKGQAPEMKKQQMREERAQQMLLLMEQEEKLREEQEEEEMMMNEVDEQEEQEENSPKQQQQQRRPASTSSSTRQQQMQQQQRWGSRPPSPQQQQRPASAMSGSNSMGSSSSNNKTNNKTNLPTFFSQLTCAPTYRGSGLLKEEDVANIVERREREAARMRKRLQIDAGHRAARILQEFKMVREDSSAGNAAVEAARRAKQHLEERKRDAAQRNELRELRTAQRRQELEEEHERRLDRYDEKNANIDERVDSFLQQRKRQFDRRRYVSAQSVVRSRDSHFYSSPSSSSSPPPPPSSPSTAMVVAASSPNQEEADQNQQQQQQPGFRQSSVASCSTTTSTGARGKTPQQQQQQQQEQFTTTNPFEIDDLLTEWRVQNCKQERARLVQEQARRRDSHLAHAAKNRSKVQRDAESRRADAARRDAARLQAAASNKTVLDSRVRGGFGLLAQRIEHAKRFVEETDRQRGDRIALEQEERVRRSEALLDSQARARRDRKVEKLFADDAADSWRQQRQERGVFLNDAKRVMLDCMLEDIEEDCQRRHAVQEQLAREHHLLQKTNHNEVDRLLDEERRALVELGLRNAIAN